MLSLGMILFQALNREGDGGWHGDWQGGHALLACAGATALDQTNELLYARVCQLLQIRLAVLYEGLERLLHYRI